MGSKTRWSFLHFPRAFITRQLFNILQRLLAGQWASQGRAGSCFLLYRTAHLDQDRQDRCAVGDHRMTGCWAQRSSLWEILLVPSLGVVFLISPTPHNFKLIDHRRSLARGGLMEGNIVVKV